MTIKEQIEIARLIASGTPREVAISEKVIPTTSMYRDELTPQQKAKARLAAQKERQDELKGKGIEKPAEPAKPAKPEKVKKSVKVIAPYQKVDKDEGDASALMKLGGNLLKFGRKRVPGKSKKIRGGYGDDEKLDAIYNKLSSSSKQPERLQATEEFIQEVEDKKDSKAKKVIDIMKGKNPIKINPDMKEDTIVVQDASGKDSVEIVDIISPQKVRSDWRKEINVTEASAAWTRKEGKKKSGGLNEKGRKSYERQNPGSDLKAPSKKVGNPRRKSFCARMKGMKKKLTSAKTARDPNSRINKSLRAWNC